VLVDPGGDAAGPSGDASTPMRKLMRPPSFLQEQEEDASSPGHAEGHDWRGGHSGMMQEVMGGAPEGDNWWDSRADGNYSPVSGSSHSNSSVAHSQDNSFTSSSGRPESLPGDEVEKEAAYAQMRAAIGQQLKDSQLSGMLRHAGGDPQLAIDMFLDCNDAPSHSHDAHHFAPPPIKPRRPVHDLQAILGPAVNIRRLAPLLAEHRGNILEAIKQYRQTDFGVPEGEPEVDENHVPEGGVDVTVNIYDLAFKIEDKDKKADAPGGPGTGQKSRRGSLNSGLPSMGLGTYHSGIEIYGREFSFGWSDGEQTGVFEVPPKCAGGVMPKITYRKSVCVGKAKVSRAEVDRLLSHMSDIYRGCRYSVIDNNCNHFSNKLSKRLCKRKIPAYVNRPAKVGSAALKASRAVGKLFSLGKSKDSAGTRSANGSPLSSVVHSPLSSTTDSLGPEGKAATVDAGSPVAGGGISSWLFGRGKKGGADSPRRGYSGAVSAAQGGRRASASDAPVVQQAARVGNMQL